MLCFIVYIFEQVSQYSNKSFTILIVDISTKSCSTSFFFQKLRQAVDWELQR